MDRATAGAAAMEKWNRGEIVIAPGYTPEADAAALSVG
jgi:hypothetical protein